jgi:hypothetical protein
MDFTSIRSAVVVQSPVMSVHDGCVWFQWPRRRSLPTARRRAQGWARGILRIRAAGDSHIDHRHPDSPRLGPESLAVANELGAAQQHDGPVPHDEFVLLVLEQHAVPLACSVTSAIGLSSSCFYNRPSSLGHPHARAGNASSTKAPRWRAAICAIRVHRPPVCPTPMVSGCGERMRASNRLTDAVTPPASALAH